MKGITDLALVIYAVSTTAPNPLQAISKLYARPIELPPWVDQTILRYILIVHPERISPLNADEYAILALIFSTKWSNLFLDVRHSTMLSKDNMVFISIY